MPDKKKWLTMPDCEVVLKSVSFRVTGLVTIQFIASSTELSTMLKSLLFIGHTFLVQIAVDDEKIVVDNCSFGRMVIDKDAEATLAVTTTIEAVGDMLVELKRFVNSTAIIALKAPLTEGTFDD